MRVVIVALLAALAPLAAAEGPEGAPPPRPAPTSSSTAPPQLAPGPPSAERPAETEPKKPTRPATGYGWSRPAKPPPSAPMSRGKPHAKRAPARQKKDLTDVWQPGFEPQPGASSTFFVNLSRKSPVEVKKSEDRLVYVIKGARAALRNNRNPLRTKFFSTPVSSARLVQVKDDVQLVFTLKRPASATWAFAPAGALMQLRISFGPQKQQPEPDPAAELEDAAAELDDDDEALLDDDSAESPDRK